MADGMVSRGIVTVTGASGFLGSTLCRFLLERGAAVRAVHRRANPPSRLAGLAALERAGSGELTIVRADLETADGARRAVEGCAAVVHAAARVTDWGTAKDFLKANYEVTVGLLDAAEAAGCTRFVSVGTVGVHGLGGHRGTTERGPYYGGLNHYQHSKLLGEKAVLSRNRPGFATSSLRMGYLYGPGDTTSTYRMFRAIEAGFFGYIGDGNARTSLMYVEDACRALYAALRGDAAAGQAINITDASAVTWKELVETMYRALGSRGKPRRLPKSLATLAAGILTAGARLAGSTKGPVLSSYRVLRSTTDCVYSNEKARVLLGFRPTVSLREGMERTAAAYLSSKNS